MNQNKFTEELPQPLSNQELILYFKKWKSGDQNARDIIIEHNRRLVFYVVSNKFANSNFEKDDLSSVGMIGLIKAVDNFKLERKTAFSSFAVICITQEILKFINYEKRQTRYESLGKVLYIDDLGHEFTLENLIASDTDTALEYANQEIYKIVRNLLETLPEKERILIQRHFGLCKQEPMSQLELAEEMKCTRQNISRILLNGYKRLKLKLVEQGIIEQEEVCDSKKKKLKKF